jgi:hypothetical protein
MIPTMKAANASSPRKVTLTSHLSLILICVLPVSEDSDEKARIVLLALSGLCRV